MVSRQVYNNFSIVIFLVLRLQLPTNLMHPILLRRSTMPNGAVQQIPMMVLQLVNNPKLILTFSHLDTLLSNRTTNELQLQRETLFEPAASQLPRYSIVTRVM